MNLGVETLGFPEICANVGNEKDCVSAGNIVTIQTQNTSLDCMYAIFKINRMTIYLACREEKKLLTVRL